MSKDTPNIFRGVPSVPDVEIFYSASDLSLQIPITLSPGFGILRAGTVISINTSTAGNFGKYVPYDPHATVDGKVVAPGRCNLLVDGAASAVAIISMADSYKWVVGDHGSAIDANTTIVDLGLLVSIDRTTYADRAVLTFTNNVTTNITTAQFGYICHKGGETAVGILTKNVDTGVGVNAAGANAAIVVSNAILYAGMLLNLDANAKTDLSIAAADVVGQFVILK